MNTRSKILQDVQNYYGKVLKTKNDLQTSACCAADSMPAYLRPYLKNIHEEVHSRFYGCASTFPVSLAGKTVVDLGCGSGRDCYLLAQVVGPEGQVIGIDMTDEQLAVARKHIDYHTDKFGLEKPNVDFRKGWIEDLSSANLEDNSVDVIISNCVINLSPDKESVFREIFRVLKPGGELYLSDVFSGRRVPEPLTTDPVLLGECLGGALYVEDFRRLLRKVGGHDYRVVAKNPITLNSEDIQRKAGMIDFYSMTIRSFKCDFEDICENFGHVAYYKGSIPEFPHGFTLDDHHYFQSGVPVPVCGNTSKMLSETRFGEHFNVIGDFSTHYGPFDCSTPQAQEGIPENDACC
ncbi:MAG: methyltransferase domain-containing protein [Nitrospina sp.]|nr:methyltransferase domain-containing protein [Nitrospina sp.]MBT6346785.1 methyltransferase domain-containing protein [Nitrospina sp.]